MMDYIYCDLLNISDVLARYVGIFKYIFYINSLLMNTL